MAPIELHFVVIGGGIGGLSTALQVARYGHSVTVLEASAATEDTGAGINVPPNAARILFDLGLGDVLHEHGVHPTALVWRRYADGSELSRYSTKEMAEKHGAPYINIHRGHLAEAFLKHAATYDKVKVRFGSPVESISVGEGETQKPSVTLTTGEVIEGDIIVGADGIRSITRPLVTGNGDRPRDTGDVAFRALLETSEMLKDPDLAPLVEQQEVQVWVGPGRHIVSYNINSKKQYHLALARPGDPSLYSNESWIVETSPETMCAGFEEWEVRVKKLLGLVKTANKRKLVDRVPVAGWIHPTGRVLLLGDSCHPMLPYRAQGAAMAMEDAATLGVLFSQITSLSEILPLSTAYQSLRSPRCAAAQLASQANRVAFHLPDGPDQVTRDAKLAEANSNPIAVENDNRTTFDYDAIKVAREWLEEYKSGKESKN